MVKNNEKNLKKRKCCFIVPYFGKLPDYFPLFLESCKFNSEFDWIFVTNINIKEKYDLPQNVHYFPMTFQELKNKMSKKFEFKVRIESYHKLCDFKPAYGFVFEDLLDNYLFWGFCDIDLIFGNLNYFISSEMLEYYDKLFCLGHFEMFKNNYENNRIFMRELGGIRVYKEVFTSQNTMVFDEPYGVGRGKCINDLFEKYGKKIFYYDYSLNLKISPANIVRTVFIPEKSEFKDVKKKRGLYLWNNGEIKFIYKDKLNLNSQRFMYIHFQSRKMKLECTSNSKTIKILGNGFFDLEFDEVSYKNFKKIKKRIFSLRYFKFEFLWKVDGLIKKIKFIFSIFSRRSSI